MGRQLTSAASVTTIAAIARRFMWDTKVILLLPARGPCGGGVCLQELPLQELRRGPIHRENVRVPQEMMCVVRNDQSLKRDSGGGKPPDEIGALAEPDVAIVIPMNHEDRRLPADDGRHGR